MGGRRGVEGVGVGRGMGNMAESSGMSASTARWGERKVKTAASGEMGAVARASAIVIILGPGQPTYRGR